MRLARFAASISSTSFAGNARVRDELLDRELFGSLIEARVVLDEYRRHYLDERPHSELGYLTPREYAQRVGHHGPTTNLNQPGLS